MKITRKTYVSDILKEYGDIAEIMEMFGIRSVGGYRLRRIITRVITVRTAALIHGVPVDNFIGMLESAVRSKAK